MKGDLDLVARTVADEQFEARMLAEAQSTERQPGSFDSEALLAALGRLFERLDAGKLVLEPADKNDLGEVLRHAFTMPAAHWELAQHRELMKRVAEAAKSPPGDGSAKRSAVYRAMRCTRRGTRSRDRRDLAPLLRDPARGALNRDDARPS